MLHHVGKFHSLGQRLKRVFLRCIPSISLFGKLALQLGYTPLELLFPSLSVIEGTPQTHLRVAKNHLGPSRGCVALLKLRDATPKEPIDEI
jgi:hypothetical protein